jgi:sirohydrochlorin ferrochelatase
LLKTTHLELNGKLFVNTQQAPTWRANYWRFDPGGSLDQRVNLSLRVLAQMGWREMEHKGETRLVLSRTRGVRS